MAKIVFVISDPMGESADNNEARVLIRANGERGAPVTAYLNGLRTRFLAEDSTLTAAEILTAHILSLMSELSDVEEDEDAD